MKPQLAFTLLLTSFSLLAPTQSQAAEMLQKGGYAARPLTLPEGTLRIDMAPSDYGYMDFGELNDGRAAVAVSGNRGGQVSVYSGAGATVGVMKDLELGALLFAIPIYPNFDFGNMEAFARYQITHGVFQLGGQVTVQIPTAGRFGVGLGMPMRILASENVRIDTGFEFEIMAQPGQVNLDIPLAFAFDIGDVFFIGPRGGIRFPTMHDVQMPLGVFLGGTLDHAVDLTGSFTFWNFVNTYSDRTVELRDWEIMFGASVYLDVF